MLEKFQKNKSLRPYSTFGIGGEAKFLIEISSISMMQEVLAFCFSEKLPYIVLGKGSNTLFDDRGYHGLAIINKIQNCSILEEKVFVGAGYSFSLLGVQTARKGLAGLEFASGIPGTIGGAIYMNAGANGGETGDVIAEVLFVNEEGGLHRFSRPELTFAYRYSSFQEKRGAIVEAQFLLHPLADARKKQLEIVAYRTRTQPYSEKSCGCIFRNPLNEKAGALIEKCGLKGMKLGDAEVSTVHANFIINTKDASAKDVLALAQLVKEKVNRQTGIELEMELRFLPYG